MSISPCPSPSPTPTFGVVVFVPVDFKASFPEFSTVVDAALSMNFEFAELQLANSCASLVCDANKRQTLLNLLVAHITQLRNGINGQPPAGIVGRIDKAQEGSVNVSADMGTVVYGQAYYLQTQWGAMFWQATARYRTARYLPPPPVCADYGSAAVNGPYGPFPGGNDNCGSC